jgi:hypothetical protein
MLTWIKINFILLFHFFEGILASQGTLQMVSIMTILPITSNWCSFPSAEETDLIYVTTRPEVKREGESKGGIPFEKIFTSLQDSIRSFIDPFRAFETVAVDPLASGRNDQKTTKDRIFIFSFAQHTADRVSPDLWFVMIRDEVIVIVTCCWVSQRLTHWSFNFHIISIGKRRRRGGSRERDWGWW